MKKKVIFDTDPGIDDAMAILFAQASGKIDLLGITTVFGNATIENATRNALYLKQRFSIPSGSCNFDLPQYHFCLAEGPQKQSKDADVWLTHFEALQKALILFLKIISI